MYKAAGLLMVSVYNTASESRILANGAEAKRPLATSSVNHRDQAAALKVIVSVERVAAAAMLAASVPIELRMRNARMATKSGTDERAGVPPAAGWVAQGKHGYDSTIGSLARRKMGSSSVGAPAGICTTVTAAILVATMDTQEPLPTRTNAQCTHSCGAAQRVHKLAPWRCDVSRFGYLPTRRAHATRCRGALHASAGSMHAQRPQPLTPTLPTLEL